MTQSEPVAAPSPAPRAPLLERLPWYTVPSVLVGVPALLAVLARVWPAQVYDKIVWRYYWGPIKADAQGAQCLTYHGIPGCSGYNIVNTLSWAVLLGLCILGAAQVLRRTRTPMDTKLTWGATGWVVAGSLFHVLEDTQLLRRPLQYFFITPPIYLIFAAVAIGTLLIGHYLRAVAARSSVELALQKLWIILCLPILGYLMLWLQRWDQLSVYLNPVLVALFALVPFAWYSWLARRRGIDPALLVGVMSVGWILLGLAYIAQYVRHPWPDRLPSPVLAALLAPLLALLTALVVFTWSVLGVGRAERRGHTKARDFALAWMVPVNLLLLFSQMLDAWATSIGIDLGSYTEKHVASRNLIEGARSLGDATGWDFMARHPTFFGFTPVKLVVSLFVVYTMDVSAPSDGNRHPNLIGLVKFAIIMVGIGPGIRDFVRMALGV